MTIIMFRPYTSKIMIKFLSTILVFQVANTNFLTGKKLQFVNTHYTFKPYNVATSKFFVWRQPFCWTHRRFFTINGLLNRKEIAFIICKSAALACTPEMCTSLPSIKKRYQVIDIDLRT